MNNKVNTNTDATAETSAQTATKTQTPAQETKWKPFEIHRRGNSSSITVNQPIRFDLRSDITDAEVAKFIREYCRNGIDTTATHIKEMSETLLMQRYDDEQFVQNTASLFMLLSDSINTHNETIELMDMFLEKEIKSEPQTFADQFKKFSGDKIGEDLTTVADQILNPNDGE